MMDFQPDVKEALIISEVNEFHVSSKEKYPAHVHLDLSLRRRDNVCFISKMKDYISVSDEQGLVNFNLKSSPADQY